MPSNDTSQQLLREFVNPNDDSPLRNPNAGIMGHNVLSPLKNGRHGNLEEQANITGRPSSGETNKRGGSAAHNKVHPI